MKKMILLVLTSLSIAACSTMQPPRYAVSVDNVEALKQYDGAQVNVTSLSQVGEFNAACRLMGPIEPADGLSIPQFIAKAMNDEFKMAGIYGSGATQLSGEVTNIKFSSISGLTNGWWDIGLNLTSSNGESLNVSNKYNFKSGFDAITACNATADALAPAVQDLLKAVIADPAFPSLLK